jgi:hypothetical protein
MMMRRAFLLLLQVKLEVATIDRCPHVLVWTQIFEDRNGLPETGIRQKAHACCPIYRPETWI